MSPIFRGHFGNALGGILMKMLAIDKINDLYDRNSRSEGPEFANSVLQDLGIDYEIIGKEKLSALNDGAFIVISNHPYGSLDGIILVDIFGHIRKDFKVMVNSFLSRISTLDDSFICVTPTGTERTAPTADSIKGIKTAIEHIRKGHPLGIFPSGAVSDLCIRDQSIRDREWQEPVIRLIKKMRVPIVPVHFLDRNSNFYYLLGLIDWRVRLMRLPSEIFNKSGRQTRVFIGDTISVSTQDNIKDINMFRDFLRSQVYGCDQ